MTVFVVTSSAPIKKAFGAIDRSRTYTLEIVQPKEFSAAIQQADETPDSFLYLDVAGMDLRAIKRRLGQLRDSRPYGFGIVDAAHTITDIGEVFRHGAADYVGKSLAKEGLSTAHLRRVVEYEPVEVPRHEEEAPSHEVDRDLRPSTSWSNVDDGSEYTFVMVYAGLDQAKELRRKSSEALLAALRKTFTGLLERTFAEFDARVWMWLEDDGLLLIPYEGGRVNAVIPAIRLFVNRMIYNTDEFAQFGVQSWRLALHLGNTSYRSSGQTGGIVSESVNYLFHVGQQFVEPGGLAVTGSCIPEIPPRVRPLLNHRGSFEGSDIYTLRDLI